MTYYQACFYCANMVETIISLAAVLASSDVFYSWTQEGFKDPTLPGSLRFTSHDGLLSMYFPLQCQDGLYFCDTDVYTVDRDPVRVLCNRTIVRCPNPKFIPTTKAQQIESKVWALHFGSPGEHQLDIFPSHVNGTPPSFEYHPFHSINFKEQTYICKQPARKLAERIPGCGSEFFMDFGFLRASSEDYKQPNKALDQIIIPFLHPREEGLPMRKADRQVGWEIQGAGGTSNGHWDTNRRRQPVGSTSYYLHVQI